MFIPWPRTKREDATTNDRIFIFQYLQYNYTLKNSISWYFLLRSLPFPLPFQIKPFRPYPFLSVRFKLSLMTLMKHKSLNMKEVINKSLCRYSRDYGIYFYIIYLLINYIFPSYSMYHFLLYIHIRTVYNLLLPSFPPLF